ncbi:hypothetical protein PIB30_056654 [Stylosanthes scabra]|uniref:Uncharacterized protein n=1 Tax=Stylosanthes scabra TaxID=79078 RepID=A0ABU6UIX7_9FABA|nr:hypothetical protein [Stylosanthes scabra]
MPDPSAGHELMRRLASRARRLVGINPKNGFSATTIMTSVHVKATRNPSIALPSEKQMIVRNTRARPLSSTRVIITTQSEQLQLKSVPKIVSRNISLVAGIHRTT